jgi:hypothetical protein
MAAAAPVGLLPGRARAELPSRTALPPGESQRLRRVILAGPVSSVARLRLLAAQASRSGPAGYDSQKTRDELAGRGMTGDIAHKGDKAPIQAGQRWHVACTSP